MFPFTVILQKKCHLSDNDHKKVLNHLEEFIRSKKETSIEMHFDSVIFRPSLFSWNWNYFALIEKGMFKLDNNRLIFQFHMYRTLLLATVASFLPFLGTKNIYVSLYFFVFSFFGNLILATTRYKRMLNDLVSEIERISRD